MLLTSWMSTFKKIDISNKWSTKIDYSPLSYMRYEDSGIFNLLAILLEVTLLDILVFFINSSNALLPEFVCMIINSFTVKAMITEIT